jgi:hypothetical protein
MNATHPGRLGVTSPAGGYQAAAAAPTDFPDGISSNEARAGVGGLISVGLVRVISSD